MRLAFIIALLLSSYVHASTTTPVAEFPFSVVPRTIRSTPHRVEITLAAVLSSAVGAPGAEVVASLKHNKTSFRYSSALKKFLKKQHIRLSELKPLRTYLRGQIKKARKDPASYVSMLDAYLRLGLAETFTVEIDQ